MTKHEHRHDVHRDGPPRVSRGRDARGSTLVELLAAVTIMGTAVVSLLTGMSTLLLNSAQNRQATTAGVIARDYAEAIELAVSQPGAWCATSYTVAYTPPAGYSVSAAFGSCPVYNAATPQFQTVAITVTSPRNYTELLRTVVRQT